jgi:hypothetical protein
VFEKAVSVEDITSGQIGFLVNQLTLMLPDIHRQLAVSNDK